MKIIDAQERYRSQIQSYRSEMSKVAKRRKEIQEQLKGATGEDRKDLTRKLRLLNLHTSLYRISRMSIMII